MRSRLLSLSFALAALTVSAGALASTDTIGCGIPQENRDNIVDNTALFRSSVDASSLPRVTLSRNDPLAQPYSAKRATCASLRAYGKKDPRTLVACGRAIGVISPTL